MSLVGEFGGTGATFIVPLLLILFMKSKQLKAVGKASIVPVAFAVNEPLLFGAPMILNPYMLIPFVAAGCVNVSVAKFFIDNVGMNGFSFVVPWATPAPHRHLHHHELPAYRPGICRDHHLAGRHHLPAVLEGIR